MYLDLLKYCVIVTKEQVYKMKKTKKIIKKEKVIKNMSTILLLMIHEIFFVNSSYNKVGCRIPH